MGFISGGTVVATCEEYDPATNTWSTKAPMPTALADLAAAGVNGRVCVAGGQPKAFEVVTTVEEYDPVTNVWHDRPPMPTGRCLLAAAVVGNRVYAIGGLRPSGATNVVEEYTTATLFIHARN